ncbi:MAG: hypothetical protein HY291_20400 [Planctomycetes bacterium]|nr:hypothetical protein [Planctomycetota bacterium]
MAVYRSVLCLAALLACANLVRGGESPNEAPGVVCHVKVLSDKVEDVSSLEAWKKTFIKDGMSSEQKSKAIFETCLKFILHELYAQEFLNAPEGCVHDPIKAFNVYGHSHCCCTAAYMSALARYVGLKARGWGAPGHSFAEIGWDNAWHFIDPAFINYFPKADGSLASTDELIAGVAEWYEKNPGYKGDPDKLIKFMRGGGWKKGPEVLSRCPFFNENGWLPEGGHGWNSMMFQFGDRSKANNYEYSYSLGYELNIQLRKGERLERNWSNQGLFIGKDEGLDVYSVHGVPGKDGMAHCTQYGDLCPGRVGNGVLEYELPLANGEALRTALVAENLAVVGGAAPVLQIKEAVKPGMLVIRMPSSYVYLTGELALNAAVGAGGEIAVSISDNNGLDWKDVKKIAASADEKIDLKPFVYRRYDYQLKFVLKGQGTGITRAKVSHIVQHSQRALPALSAGPNTISFSAGPAEGTIALEGCTDPKASAGKQLAYTAFHPQSNNIQDPHLLLSGGGGDVTFPVETPGDLKRLRINTHYRARDAKDGWEVQVSLDEGKTFKTLERGEGPTIGNSTLTNFSELPAHTRKALVRFAGHQRNTLCMFNFRIDADYEMPCGGFHPLKVTYRWEENGQKKQDVRVAQKPAESWTIQCGAQPVMKSIVLEWAE